MSTHRVDAVGATTSLADRKRRAGQRLIIGLAGPSLSDVERRLIRQIRPAGFILFSRNVEEPAQVRELNRELRSLLPAELPALCTVDQEGGRVQRIQDGATRFPPLRHVGNLNDLDLTRRYAEALADEVLALGFDLNWAPVADVDSNPDNPIIGDRAFGRDAQAVARQVYTYVAATQERGLMASAKHFPGHGDTSQDSHLTLPVVEKDPPDLEHVELAPFRAAIQAHVATIMTAHVVYPGWEDDVPATLSSRILSGILRQQLGYGGLIVSDDLEMKAVRGRFPLEVQLRRACAATVDIFLACKSPELQLECFEELVRLQEGDATQDLLAEDSERRLLRARERFLLARAAPPALAVLDQQSHRDLVHLVRARGAG